MGSCLTGLFGKHLGSWGSAILTISCLFFVFFYSIFLVGGPYLSLIIILGCFIFYNWYYIRPLINSKFFLGFNIFISTIFIFIESNFCLTVMPIQFLIQKPFLQFCFTMTNLRCPQAEQVKNTSIPPPYACP